MHRHLPRRASWGVPLRLLILAPIAASSFFLSSCPLDRRGPSPPPNLILVTLDTTRADFCSLYGFPYRTTPALEALAEGGVVFDSAIAPSTWTLPVHASLWTGLHPSVHGAVSSLSADGGEYGRPLPERIPVLPQILQERGYQTAAFIGGPFVTRGFGFERGFETFDDLLDEHGRSAAELNRLISEWLGTRRDARPLFLFVNYYDPHRPYAPPADLDDPFGDPARCRDPEPRDFDPRTSGTLQDPVAVECARVQYAREIRAADRALGQLLESLRRRGDLERALVAVVGDHGEAFGENGAWAHGGAGFLHQRRVPLVIARTGERPTTALRVPGGVSITRLSRTLLEAAGIEAPAAWLGPSLLSGGDADLAPLTERFTREASYHSVTLPSWTYFAIARPDGRLEEQYFRIVEAGLEEFVPLREVDAGVVAQAEAAWSAIRARLGPLRQFAERPRPADDELVRQLRELGYVR